MGISIGDVYRYKEQTLVVVKCDIWFCRCICFEKGRPDGDRVTESYTALYDNYTFVGNILTMEGFQNAD